MAHETKCRPWSVLLKPEGLLGRFKLAVNTGMDVLLDNMIQTIKSVGLNTGADYLIFAESAILHLNIDLSTPENDYFGTKWWVCKDSAAKFQWQYAD